MVDTTDAKSAHHDHEALKPKSVVLRYPKQFEIGMNVLQYFVLEDGNVPKDIAQSFNTSLLAYKQFKAEAI